MDIYGEKRRWGINKWSVGEMRAIYVDTTTYYYYYYYYYNTTTTTTLLLLLCYVMLIIIPNYVTANETNAFKLFKFIYQWLNTAWPRYEFNSKYSPCVFSQYWMWWGWGRRLWRAKLLTCLFPLKVQARPQRGRRPGSGLGSQRQLVSKRLYDIK